MAENKAQKSGLNASQPEKLDRGVRSGRVPGEDAGNVGGKNLGGDVSNSGLRGGEFNEGPIGGERVDDIAGEVKGKIREVTEGLRENVTPLKDRGKKALDDVRDRAGPVLEQSRTFIDENSTLLIGIGVGIVGLGLVTYLMNRGGKGEQLDIGAEAAGYGEID